MLNYHTLFDIYDGFHDAAIARHHERWGLAQKFGVCG